jgi:hypothetical protein
MGCFFYLWLFFGNIIPLRYLINIDFIMQTNTTPEHYMLIYLLFCNMFRPFYSAIIRQKHNYIDGNLCLEEASPSQLA